MNRSPGAAAGGRATARAIAVSGALEDLVEREVGGEAGGVRQQLGDGDRPPALTPEPRHVDGDAVAQPETPLLDEHHDAGGGRHHLGQGREVEHRVERHRLGCSRRQRTRAEGPLVHDLAAVPHQHHRRRKTPVADGLLDQRVDPGEAGRVDLGRRRRRVTGEPQAGGGEGAQTRAERGRSETAAGHGVGLY